MSGQLKHASVYQYHASLLLRHFLQGLVGLLSIHGQHVWYVNFMRLVTTLFNVWRLTVREW